MFQSPVELCGREIHNPCRADCQLRLLDTGRQLQGIKESVDHFCDALVRLSNDGSHVSSQTAFALLLVPDVELNAGQRRRTRVPHVDLGAIGHIAERPSQVADRRQRMLAPRLLPRI